MAVSLLIAANVIPASASQNNANKDISKHHNGLSHLLVFKYNSDGLSNPGAKDPLKTLQGVVKELVNAITELEGALPVVEQKTNEIEPLFLADNPAGSFYTDICVLCQQITADDKKRESETIHAEQPQPTINNFKEN